MDCKYLYYFIINERILTSQNPKVVKTYDFSIGKVEVLGICSS